MQARLLSTAEIAAVLGVTPAAVRKIVSRHRIRPLGTRGRANLYRFADVRRHAGGHDRLTVGKRRRLMSH